MSQEQKNNLHSWQPTAALHVLRKRAEIIDIIRQFFKERCVLEVDTPLLSSATVTDPYVLSIPALCLDTGREYLGYLQTSPEYAMKRLLAAGIGSIYQICKAFRQGDCGKLHHPEFTLLEWYRPGFDHHALMDEMDILLQAIFTTPAAERLSYQQVFMQFVGIDPHVASVDDVMQCVRQHGIHFNSQTATDYNTGLDLLLTHCIGPQLGHDCPLFLYDFPITQAALAKIRYTEIPPVASRFEVYFKGIELANGFHELQDAKEQRKRFLQDLAYRKEHNIQQVPLDEKLLAALAAGLPDCAGVALGIDRLVMLALGKQSVAEVMSFAVKFSEK